MKQYPPKYFGFVHITKTGGASFHDFIYHNYLDYFIFDSIPHQTTAISYSNPVIIVRNPFDRFLSMFNYWQNGSELYDPLFGKTNISIPVFFKYFYKGLLSKESIKTYVWKHHFLPQTYWLSEDCYQKSTIIVYNQNFENTISKFTKIIGLPKPIYPLKYINKSKKHIDYLTSKDKKIIYQHYQKDFELYYNICSHPDRFKLVIS